MGWYFGYASRKAVIAELTADNEVCVTLRKYTSGNTLWAVQQNVKTGGKFIGCYLMQRSSDGWGYKPMEECMGPCETTCPLAFFNDVEDPGGFATDWRQQCREDHARRNLKLDAGDHVKLTNGRTYRVTSVRPLMGLDVVNRAVYRLPRKMLASKNPTPYELLREASGNVETLDTHQQIVRIAHYLGTTQIERRPLA